MSSTSEISSRPSLKKATRKLSHMLMMSHLSPLPIYDVGHDVETAEKATGEFGCVFPHIDHLSVEPHEAAAGCPIGNAARSRRKANVMAELESRFWKKVNAQATRTLVYQRPSANSPSKEYIPSHNDPSCLRFNSWFESGNMDCAFRVHGRNYDPYLPQCTKHLTPIHRATKSSRHGVHGTAAVTELLLPIPFDHEYDLYCDCDTYTHGHIQWYYFQVKVQVPEGKEALTVRFNIRNMLKRDSLYNFGMLPTVYSQSKATRGQLGWIHSGEEAFYYQNADEFTAGNCRRGKRYYFTLSFVYRFEASSAMADGTDTVYFAHCFPYTYTSLQAYLNRLLLDPIRSPNVRRRTLCATVCGNACEVLTITEHTPEPHVISMRIGIILTARVHPGETNGSFVMQGIIDYLTGPTKEAKRLRQCFVFKIIPMLNPDGVIHGNYRCSLAGVDLNRRWSKPSQTNHPTIYAAKQMITAMRNSRRVVLFCDIHGHSRKKNMFMYANAARGHDDPELSAASYGCKPYFTWSKFEAAKMRLFPYLLSKVSSAEQGGYFSFPDCTFNVARSKRSTGRVSVWNDIRILNSFTLEASFCGTGENQLRQRGGTACSPKHKSTTEETSHYMIRDLIQSGEKFCCALGNYGRLLAIEPVDESSVPSPKELTPSSSAEDLPSAAAADWGDLTDDAEASTSGRFRDDNNDFVFSPDAINLLEEIETTTPLSADADCNSSGDSDGSDSNPSGDNMDADELENDSRWLAFQRHRATRRQPRLRVIPSPTRSNDSPPSTSMDLSHRRQYKYLD
ncbi:Aste57867_1944 [Aphanomyces stellatus]|uniref:Aste57867_1944 protein n=1 Tax=Aphanomyces stellatus TaxID=120398 RepID=A0A485KAP5_9STRA|nr:hypothetical protein As57867_001942 [Aphanomyces stellatus]VFT79149.1 Aste57867_1944 [Aphanomyces stellatus]